MNYRDKEKIYTREVSAEDYNLPVVISAKMLREKSRVLDCGCARGDNGVFLAGAAQAELYGMEYDEESLACATQKAGIYKKLHRADLNAFSACEYGEYYRFFDHILLLDVLARLYSPLDVLHNLCPFLKKDGSFIISLPNIAHAHPVLNLLKADFTYHDSGIPDFTHIRFFTWKSLAVSLAERGFRVDDSSVTFVAPDTRGMFTPKLLPASFYTYLLKTPHSLVCRYVCKIRASDAEFGELKTHNLASLERSIHKNADGWRAISYDMSRFRRKLALMQGRGLGNIERKRIRRLAKEEKYLEAVVHSGLFDEEWYRKTYNEVDFSALHPLAHYLNAGWREGKNPSEAFDGNWYLQRYPFASEAGVCPLLFHVTVGCIKGFAYNQAGLTITEEEFAAYAKYVLRQEEDGKNTFIPMSAESYKARPEDTRLIAFYLPQFYPFPENDAWWGKGFTEWTNVTRAVPQFVGHYQPRLPYDVGFYDLRVRETRLYQEELAEKYGIHGFCYHYYWFDGKKLMDGPIENKLRDPDMRLPFCICWANESWNANWDGCKNDLLIDQPPCINAEALFHDLLPFFCDTRYIKVAGKPFFMIYRPSYFKLENLRECIGILRSLAVQHGLSGLHIVLGNTFRTNENKYRLAEYGADAFIDFPPHQFTMGTIQDVRICNPKFKGRIFDLPELVKMYKQRQIHTESTYKTVFPMWDNTARKAESGATIYINASPEVYYDWLSYAIHSTKSIHRDDSNFVFINAWNEWAEGAYLEPDGKYGYAFLAATKAALIDARREGTNHIKL
jgi:2-polyprenyl-3-methyl-5-hydroxy-6-metoxy-1,4-benzoquinol methylase